MMFQSTPPHGRRLRREYASYAAVRVSIHASAREATPLSGAYKEDGVGFNPRLRTGGDRPHWPAYGRPGRCFNPRLRTGGDSANYTQTSAFLQVSIHASAREATAGEVYRDEGPFEFQSTPPHGRRPGLGVSYRLDTLVSIHASAREATRNLPRLAAWVVVSIHASAREATGPEGSPI